MSSLRSSRSILVLAAMLSAACGSAQKVSVRTDPIGAEVYLQRRGDIEIDAKVSGIPGKVTTSRFEEDFRLIGNAPVDYEFDLSETEVGVDVPGGSGKVIRHYREGTIRIERTSSNAPGTPSWVKAWVKSTATSAMPLPCTDTGIR